MKIYLISQNENTDYDTFDSAVVLAPNEEVARNMHPSDGKPINWNEKKISIYNSWCSSPDSVKVTYLGESEDPTTIGVVCASFNAG